jgi:hypothetical protein
MFSHFRLVVAAFALAGAASLSCLRAEAAPRIAEPVQIGPGSGRVVFLDVLQQASPWLSDDGSALDLDNDGNLRDLRPGQSADRIVFARERYPAGDYLLEWTGRASFAVSGATLLPGGGPNAAIVRVTHIEASGLRLRVTATDPEHPVRNLHLYLPGSRIAAAKSVFTPAFLNSLSGADVIDFTAWSRVDSFAGPAEWPLRSRVDQPTQATAAGAALEDEILLANLTGAHPLISIPAGATDGFIRGEARVILRTLDPSLRPVLNLGGREILVANSPANQWAVTAARNLRIAPGEPQAGARMFAQRRYADALAIFREVFGPQAGRIVPADSPELASLHRLAGNPDAVLQPDDDSTPAETEHVPVPLPVFHPGVAGAPHPPSPLDLGGRPGVAIGLGVPLRGANRSHEGAAAAIARSGSSYVVTAPADRSERSLRVYASGEGTTATLSATLDGKTYSGATFGNRRGANDGVWTIIYRARSAGERLVVRVTPAPGGTAFAVHGASVAVHDLRGIRNTSPSDEGLYHNDLLRTGWNPNETTLTTSNVNASAFGQVGTLAVDGNVLAQPLYLAGLTVGGQTHNVLIMATENASVYEFDADTGAQLNKVSLGTAASSKNIGCSDITPQYGITSTPVVNRAGNALYVVAVTEPKKKQFAVTLHSLNLTTLADNVTPVAIDPSVTLNNGEQVGFNPQNQHVRPGLVWANNSLYLGIGSHCDNDAGDIVGWVLDYDPNLNPLAAFPTIEDHASFLLSSVWQSGFAPAVSATGDLYFATGNGAFDASSGGKDYGESVVRINSGLTQVESFFTPHEWKKLNANDEDLGSGGVMLLPQQQGAHPNILVAQGKSSKIYLLDALTLGGETKTDSGALQILKPTGGGVWGGPTYYSGPTGQFVYYQTGGDVLRAYALGENSQGLPTLTLSSAGSSQAGYGGSTPVVSSNAQVAGTGIVWEVERGNKDLTLEAYDATNLTSLLFSAKAGTWPKSNGFETLLVANGKVYVPSQNEVTVFGLK